MQQKYVLDNSLRYYPTVLNGENDGYWILCPPAKNQKQSTGVNVSRAEIVKKMASSGQYD
jgi:hypothetical protein